MNAHERAIWCAAYGAAFARVFLDLKSLIERNPEWGSATEYPHDRAAAGTNAEEAWDIADHAVRRYREWLSEELDGQHPDPKEVDRCEP
jgi:hypothetical protein